MEKAALPGRAVIHYSIIGLRAKQCTTYTNTQRNKKHTWSIKLSIFIVLALQSKILFNHMPYTTYIDQHGALMLMGSPGNYPSCPCCLVREIPLVAPHDENSVLTVVFGDTSHCKANIRQ